MNESMKIIECDICKRIIGKTVDIAGWMPISVPKYSHSDFMKATSLYKDNADFCTECFSEIAQAQNEAIERIIARFALHAQEVDGKMGV